ELVPSEAFLRLYDRHVGDTVTLRTSDGQARVRIVGSFANSDDSRLMLDAASLPGAAGGIERRPFAVIVKPGTDPADYVERLNSADGSTGLFAEVAEPDLGGAVVFDGLFLLFSLIICMSAGVGVLNSV